MEAIDRLFVVSILIFMVALSFALTSSESEASRDSCECRELRAIRQLLQHQLGVVCDERRCLPVPTPTSDGGELP
jgi:hypothetical protein